MLLFQNKNVLSGWKCLLGDISILRFISSLVFLCCPTSPLNHTRYLCFQQMVSLQIELFFFSLLSFESFVKKYNAVFTVEEKVNRRMAKPHHFNFKTFETTLFKYVMLFTFHTHSLSLYNTTSLYV